jgi:YD repeat-containing protein
VEYAQDGQTILSPTKVTGRDGRAVRHRYNALGQRSVSIDAKQQPTFYEWCLCGDLKKLTDAKGLTTTWRHDIQGRVTAKITPNGDTTTYQFYPVSGRLKAVTLPKDQALVAATFTLKYDALGRLVKQDFTDAATPDVSYTAFDAFSRLKEMTDGLGTTALSYHPFGQVGGGQLRVLDGPLVDDALRYSFTHFGRALRTENVSEPVTGGSAVRQFVEHGYDFMGRAAAVSTDMGSSAVGYLSTNFTGKADSITHQVGGVDAVRSSYGYFPAANTAQHGRLQSITHAFPAGGGAWTMQAQHDYAYDVAGRGHFVALAVGRVWCGSCRGPALGDAARCGGSTGAGGELQRHEQHGVRNMGLCV